MASGSVVPSPETCLDAQYLVQNRQSKVRRYVHEYAFIPIMVPKNLENLRTHAIFL